MRRILIVKTGRTLPVLIPARGDFEDWILSGMAVERERITVVDVAGGSLLPEPEEVSGIVVAGSHRMVTERLGWSERTAEWLCAAVKRRVPALGICFGHQLLAHALGGEVGINPNGREFGTIEVGLRASARSDGLLGDFPSLIKVQASHMQSVLRVPEMATVLASSDMDPNAVFVVGTCAWGVQFHPEFDAEITIAYVDAYRDALLEDGKDPDRLIEGCTDTPYGTEILRRFADVVGRSN